MDSVSVFMWNLPSWNQETKLVSSVLMKGRTMDNIQNCDSYKLEDHRREIE
jgi:hypothetical protein